MTGGDRLTASEVGCLLVVIVIIIIVTMLTTAWFKLNPHPAQSTLYRSTARFNCVVAGRGSGKTEIERRKIVRWLPVVKPWHDPLYFYCLPTVQQAKRIAWRKIKPLIPANWIKKINETEMLIETIFGSSLQIFGMDKPQRMEGSQYDGGVVDESSDQKPDVFDATILPALAHRRGWCDRIGVPKRYGIGAENFKAFFDKGIAGEAIPGTDIKIQSHHWTSDGIVSANELAWARANLDLRDYNERYRASWEKASGQIFYCYDNLFNIDSQVCYRSDMPIVIGSDFNVNPMAWVLGHRYKNELHIWEEIWIRNTSTQEALNFLYKRFGGHVAGFEFYGDATGRARKTAAASAAQSDYIIIRNDKRFTDSRVYYPKSNPAVVDRFAACNAMFCNVQGERRIKIHPRCIQLCKDLLARTYIEGTREPDDSGDIGHISDALGYVVHRLFPLRNLVADDQGIVTYANAG